MIDIHRLRILREVARHGSFAAAARSLRFTPSAVSQQVAALERSLGVPVVDRSTRGVRLTEPGRVLLRVADSVAGELALAERHLARLAEGRQGRLTVATFASAGQALLPRALAPLTARPEVALTVLEAEPERSLPLVREGEADVALVYHFHSPGPPGDYTSGLVYTPLLRDPMYLVVPDRHPLAGADQVRIGQFADDLWVHGWGTCGEAIERAAAAAGFQPRVACRSSDYVFVQTVVAAGVGVALVPQLGLVSRPGTVALRLSDPPVRRVGAIRPDRWQAPLAAELLYLLATAA